MSETRRVSDEQLQGRIDRHVHAPWSFAGIEVDIALDLRAARQELAAERKTLFAAQQAVLTEGMARDKAEASVAMLREALDLCSGHVATDLCTCHIGDRFDCPMHIVTRALSDTAAASQQFLGRIRAEERERVTEALRDYLRCVPCPPFCSPPGLHVDYCPRRIADEPGFRIRALGAEAATEGGTSDANVS